MRWVAVSAIGLAACIAGAALAQDNSPMVFVPTWEVEPRPADIISHYPRGALARNVSGIGVLCCTAREDRSLDCAISSEWPSGEGFGPASAEASRGYRLTAESHGDLVARPGTQVRLSMMWAGSIFSDDMRAELSRRGGDTAFACLPPE
jgi:hypothetical protein